MFFTRADAMVRNNIKDKVYRTGKDLGADCRGY